MDNARAILKNAFIDAQFGDTAKSHIFSAEFERKMQDLIRYQKGLLKLINTTGKKVACILLSILIIATSTVFSVEALREPVIEAIQSFFVNVKEQLMGTRAKNIADYFVEDITQIKATNYFTAVPKEHIINDKQKIDEFIKLLSETEWQSPKNEHIKNVQYVFWKFEFNKNEELVTTLNLCESPTGTGCIKITNKNSSKVFTISERIYRDIMAFTNTKYFLHKSDIATPSEATCLAVQNNVFYDLTTAEKDFISNEIRIAHMQIENMLLDSVSALKDPDSQYWYPAITGEEFKDPFSEEIYINGDWCFNSVIEHLDNISKSIKNKEIKSQFEAITENLQIACNNHDIGGIFSIHEFIHDFDYFAINYPAYFEVFAPPDWDGIDIYFGHLE